MRDVAIGLVMICSAAFVNTAKAQRQEAAPQRPKLEEGVDTNDAHGYLDYGLVRLTKDPKSAAAAFYWASRLDPSNTDALQARRVAMLLDDGRLFEYLGGSRKVVDDADVRRADALQERAVRLNPFIYRQYDRYLFTEAVAKFAKEVADQTSNDVTSYDVEKYMETQLRDAGPAFRAWQAYGQGRFDKALDLYATAISRRDGFVYHVERGQIFFLQTKFDSAIAELNAALGEMRKRDRKSLVWYYQSKALLEHSIGIALEAKGDAAGARAAYGRALQEELSFYPAHVRLGGVALAQGDTATALTELGMAADLAPNDATILYQYGFLLASAGKLAEGKAALQKAVAAEPYYAAPYYFLGRVADAQGDSQTAIARYKEFIAHAPASDDKIDWTMQRVGALQAGGKK